MQRYAVRIEVYVDAEDPAADSKQVEQLMSSFRGAPWLIRYIRAMTPADQRLLDDKQQEGSKPSSDTP